MADYLLHSIAEFGELIDGLFETAAVRRVIEVGVETGRTSAFLTRLLGTGGSLVSIDPSLGEDVRPLGPGHRIVRQRSTEALQGLGPADAVLLDGDHNYFTVSTELELIEKEAEGHFPLVLLHDVRWPWGRRDLYYRPDDIPPSSQNAPVYRGVVRSHPGTVAGGFHGAGHFAVASWEGGPHNGVQTAVDDFLALRRHLAYRVVPVIFGLGVLYDPNAPYAPAIDRFLAPYHELPLLARLEDNRLALYLRVLELQELLAQR